MMLFPNPKKLLGFTLLAGIPMLYACTSTTTESTAVKAPIDERIIAQRDYVIGDNNPFPECHASTLVRLQDGSFMVAWFGGTKEKDDDVGIWMSKGRPGNWTTPKQIAKIRDDAHWNPVLHATEDGKVILFFKVGKEISHWETWVSTSTDGGETWSTAHELVANDKGGRGPVKNKMIELSDGTWLAGSSIEPGRWDVFVDRSEDKGKTWVATPLLAIDTVGIKGKGAIQPTMWESAPGKVHMLVRTTGGVIGRSDSEDNGKTWSTIVATDMPNPNSGIDLAKLSDGTLAMMYNPDNKDWGSRSPISLALSYDNGKTWPEVVNIDGGDVEDEFSYPAIISWGDSIATTYTWNRKKIGFWWGKAADIKALSSEGNTKK